MLFHKTLHVTVSAKIFGDGAMKSWFFCDECIGFIWRKQGKEATHN
jgi:hypothetical protein